MATMNISLPEEMKSWVEEQATGGLYSNSSDYVRDLIRHDQERSHKIAKLQALVREGFDSGESDRTPEDIRQAARQASGVNGNL